MAQFKFVAIGTSWQIDIYDALSPHDEEKILKTIKDRIEEFEQTYSRFRDDSLISKISREGGEYILPDDAEPMLSLYRELYALTDGLVTPLIGGLISDAGYDANYTLVPKQNLKSPPSWDDVMAYKHPVLSVKKPVSLDFGAAGKGYLIDLVGKLLEENSIKGYCIDAGGDILRKAKDNKPMRIGLENPQNTTEAVGVYELTNGSICGSAGSRRAWGNFTHIINPKTQTSPRDIIAVWVMADSALLADALTTCLFFVPAAKIREAYKFEYVLLNKDYSVEKSEGFSGELFL